VFSVTSESSAPSPARSEPPRLSTPDAPSQPNGFAALVDANAESSRSTTTDRRDPPQSSSRASRQDRDPPREAAPEVSTPPAESPRNAESAATGESSRHATGKPSKQTKSGKTSDDPADANRKQTSDVAAPASAPDVPVDPSAIVATAVTAPPTTATPTPAASSAASGSASAPPLSIAAAAIATSAQASAMSTQSGNETSPIVEAVAGAAGEVNATNFTIAKTIATTPVPASEAAEQAELAPPTTPQLASAVATVASKVIKSSDKLVVTQATTTADGTAPDQASQPPSPNAAVPSAAHPGATQANPHQQSNADATPASPSSQVDRSNGDPTTPSAGGHHAATVASQPQALTPDALSQLGATMAAPQTPATTAIPAAQLTATAVTNLAVPVSGLAVQIAASARAGNSRFEIRLDPAELGRIDVRLDVDKHGQVSSHLTVEKPETLAMLRQDAPQLQRALEDAGLKTGQNGLQFSLRDQSSGQQNSNNGQAERQPQRLVISDTATAAPLAPLNATYAYAASASRGVDIRV
jgi:flagellar hook-length control protein FliK